MSVSNRTLPSGFFKATVNYPECTALEVEGKKFTYKQLDERACSIAATLQQYTQPDEPPLTAVFAYRSLTAFSGILGSLFRGNGYVPLNRTFPPERTRTMLTRSECRSLIVDLESAKQLDEILSGINYSLTILLPEHTEIESISQRWPQHTILSARDFAVPGKWINPSVSPDQVAYLLFTSGSTGIPKGVMVAHRNVIPFIDYMVERYSITSTDRFSQMFDMTFDLSVFDMFVAWEQGACVCCPDQKILIKPGKFIQDAQLTVWFSVPSTGVFMKRLGELKPNRYPSLRWSLFCGEPLPVAVVQAWTEAAPNSIIENLYGPTELTIACTLYRWDPEKSFNECEMGVVPIGDQYPGMKILIVDENLNEVEPGGDGELLMTGPQLSLGYWKDLEKTEKAFMIPPGKNEIYYRTGDRVRRPVAGKPMTHLGRVDFQTKIHGHRVELGEIEAVLREESGIDAVVAVGWPITVSGAAGIEAFIGELTVNPETLRTRVATRLPDYMVPRKIHLLDKFPLNSNGKFDRKALIKMLEKSEVGS